MYSNVLGDFDQTYFTDLNRNRSHSPFDSSDASELSSHLFAPSAAWLQSGGGEASDELCSDTAALFATAAHELFDARRDVTDCARRFAAGRFDAARFHWLASSDYTRALYRSIVVDDMTSMSGAGALTSEAGDCVPNNGKFGMFHKILRLRNIILLN